MGRKIFIPEKIRGFPLGRTLLVSSWVCLVLSVAAFAYLSHYFFHRYLSIDRKLATLERDEKAKLFAIKTLEKESELQQGHFKNFSQNLKSLEERMARLQQFSQKLKELSVAGFPSKKPIRAPNVGGPVASSLARVEKESVLREEILRRIYGQLQDIRQQISAQERSFQEIEQVLEKQKTLLASTPSLWPTRGWVTSGFGQRLSPFSGRLEQHEGVDIASYNGTPVRAPADGSVIEVSSRPGYGNFIVIDHGHDIVTRYGHNRTIWVKVGQKVKRGDIIAEVGNTGRSTGPHLHYEVLVKGIPVNPMAYILD